MLDILAMLCKQGVGGSSPPSSTCENGPEQIVMPCGGSSTICARRKSQQTRPPSDYPQQPLPVALIDFTNL